MCPKKQKKKVCIKTTNLACSRVSQKTELSTIVKFETIKTNKNVHHCYKGYHPMMNLTNKTFL